MSLVTQNVDAKICSQRPTSNITQSVDKEQCLMWPNVSNKINMSDKTQSVDKKAMSATTICQQRTISGTICWQRTLSDTAICQQRMMSSTTDCANKKNPNVLHNPMSPKKTMSEATKSVQKKKNYVWCNIVCRQRAMFDGMICQQ